MPRPRPRRTPVRDRWSPRPETPAGKSQPKPLPRPARERSGSLSCTTPCSNPAWKPAAPRPLPATSRCRRLRMRTSACREPKTIRPKVWPCENAAQRLRAGGSKTISRQLQVDDEAVGSDAGGQGLSADTGPKFTTQLTASPERGQRPRALRCCLTLLCSEVVPGEIHLSTADRPMAALSQAQAMKKKEGGAFSTKTAFFRKLHTA